MRMSDWSSACALPIFSLLAPLPFGLTQAQQLTVGGGLDLIDQDIALSGVKLNRDRLLVVNLRADAGWIDAASIAGRGGYSPAEPRWSLATSFEARKCLISLASLSFFFPSFLPF